MQDFMNKPIEQDGNAYKQHDYKQNIDYIHCCYCGKKLFPIANDTVIRNLKYKCRGSNCKRFVLINL